MYMAGIGDQSNINGKKACASVVHVDGPSLAGRVGRAALL